MLNSDLRDILQGTLRDIKTTSRFLVQYDVIMSAMASQITSLMIVYSIVYSGADQRKHQSSASLAFLSGIHRWPVNSPHKWPVAWKLFPFDDVIMDFVFSLMWITSNVSCNMVSELSYMQEVCRDWRMLTYWGWITIADIFAYDNFKCIFPNENHQLDLIFTEVFPDGAIDNKSALVHVRAWHQTGRQW